MFEDCIHSRQANDSKSGFLQANYVENVRNIDFKMQS